MSEGSYRSLSIFLTFCGVLCSVFTIVFDYFLPDEQCEGKSVSWLFIISIVLLILAILLFILSKSHRLNYFIVKQVKYLFAGIHAPYKVLDFESKYTIKKTVEMVDGYKKAIHMMDHCKKYTIQSKTNPLNVFSHKFRWTKIQSEQESKQIREKMIEDTEQECTDLKLTAVEDATRWIRYFVNFPGMDFGQKRDISIRIKDLKDENQVTKRVLSGNVEWKAKQMTLRVEFEDCSPVSDTIKYEICKNEETQCAYIQKPLELKYVTNGNGNSYSYVEYTEKKPIKGYRYKISWDYPQMSENTEE